MQDGDVMAKNLGIYIQAKVNMRRANDACVAQSQMASYFLAVKESNVETLCDLAYHIP
jgi:hypothetical protein